MKSTFIAIAILICSVAGGYFAGAHVTKLTADVKAKRQLVQALEHLNQANLRVRALEEAAQESAASRAAQLKQEKAHAKADRQKFVADIRHGAISVSIPVASAPNTTGADPTLASGNGHETRAQLDPQAAADLEAIAGDGDDAIRQLNACIDTYNNIRGKYNVQAE